VRGAAKRVAGVIGEPVVVAGARIRQGDAVVLDADGAVVVPADRVDAVMRAGREREGREAEARARYAAGERSYDLNDLRRLVEG
jgi:4-hydroxy-4-methyl-2-oxoglutarate aldolase